MSQTKLEPETKAETNTPIQTPDHEPVMRQSDPVCLEGPGPIQEIVESLRDLFGASTRLRMSPFGSWYLDEDAATRKVWSGYGHRVELTTSRATSTWSVSLTDPSGMIETSIAEDCPREVAYREATGAMRRISMEHAA